MLSASILLQEQDTGCFFLILAACANIFSQSATCLLIWQMVHRTLVGTLYCTVSGNLTILDVEVMPSYGQQAAV